MTFCPPAAHDSLFRPALSRRALRSALLPALCATAALLMCAPSHADTYHSVEPGDTLASVAARYNTRPDVLRKANKLSSYGDGMTLPAMLLRVPDAPQAQDAPSNSGSAASGNAANGSGSVRATAAYRVQPGDTLESIAQRYNAAGYRVTVQDIRLRNTLDGQPAVGTTVYVPLGGATYAPQPQRTAPVRPGGSGGSGGYTPNSQSVGGGAFLSEELPLPMAQVYQPEGEPVYRAPNAPRRTPQRRGPTRLPARGYFPSPSLNGRNTTLDGARLLAPSEDGPNMVPDPTPGVGRAPQPRRSVARAVAAPALGRVAQVAHGGAKIRRLPSTGAATLYRCSVGTEIAVTRTQGAWVAILMSDRSTGWMPARYVRYTGAAVDVSSVTRSAPDEGQAWSSGGSFALSGNWTSDNPVVAQALTWLGTPYVYGGTGRRGIDCSALVQNSFRACGYSLPRTAAQQARVGAAVDPANLQAGDRLYFSASGTRIDHTGLYIGNGKFVQASGRGRAVIVSNLADPRNWNIFVCARR